MGAGLLLSEGEPCELKSETDAILLTVEADQLTADPCGTSLPDRVMGQLWSNFQSN